MFKRTNSYLLLTFLVLTGFGGRHQSESLPGKERKTLLKDLKEGRKEFFQSLEELSPAQLDYKTSANDWSVREHIYHLALCESRLWTWTSEALKQMQNGDKNLAETPAMTLEPEAWETHPAMQPTAAHFRNIEAALEDFRKHRKGIIKFVRTTTDDIRNCRVKCPLADMDSYQLLLFLSDHTEKHVQEIERIKSSPGYPK